MLDRILAVARAEVRRGRRLPLDQPGAEQTSTNTVSEQAVTAVIRRVGDRTRQVQIRRCALTLDQTATDPVPSPNDADDGAAAMSVSLRVSVARDLSVIDASNQLRGAVVDAVRQEVGLHVARVDIFVEDLHDA